MRTFPEPPTDFDFILGDWQVRHRSLNARLTGCTGWTVFEGTSSTRNIHALDVPEGQVRAAALRSFDAASQTWSIWWLDGRAPHRLDVPVVGSFAAGRGTFFANDALAGRPIQVRFLWHPNPGGDPHWEQAFSADDRARWETNWTMEFQRRLA